MKAWINGIGWSTPAGCGMGRDGGAQPMCPGVLAIPARKQVFEQADMRFGRLDAFSRVGLAALAFCLRDAGQEVWHEKRAIGVIAASRYGCLATDLAYLQTMLPDNGKLASPNLFAYTLPNCFLGEAALRFGLAGNCLVLNRADASRLEVVRYALEELAWSEQPAVLTGVCDLAAPSGQEDDLPGAVFLYLDRSPGADRCYGQLELQAEQLSLDGLPVVDLRGLLDACLTPSKQIAQPGFFAGPQE